MGYRHYFYLADKKDIEAVSKMTMADIKTQTTSEDENDDDWKSPVDLVKGVKVFEFGKLYWCDTEEKVKRHSVPLFLDEDSAEYYSDYGAVVVGKEGVLAAIHAYQEQIMEYVNNELKEDSDEYLANRHKYYLNMLVFDFREKYFPFKENQLIPLPDASLKTHVYFNLILLYNMIDWDNKSLVFLGY